MVLSYIDVIRDEKQVGNRVALIGAGGIGFDVADFLSHHESESNPIQHYLDEWGVDQEMKTAGGLQDSQDTPAKREIFLCQRKAGKLGAGLGKTTGWIHRSALKKRDVQMLARCQYERIDDEGLHITIDGKERLLAVDNIVVCAGQVSKRDLEQPLLELGVPVHVIGGALQAGELDARRAFDQGTRLAAGF